jgi:hypothetical protein
MKKQRMKAVALSTVISAGALLAGAAQANQSINSLVAVGDAKVSAARESQVRINKMQDETTDLVTQFSTVSKQIDSLKMYNSQMETKLSGQRSELAALDEAIAGVSVIQREIPPLIVRMLDAIEQFVQLDAPYKREVRLDRIAKQRVNLQKANISEAEKFRQVVELYNIEAEYARKIDTYTDTIDFNGAPIEVNVLAVGRVALMFQTADRSVTGAWNRTTKQWEALPDSPYKDSVFNGIRMAQKKASNDILALPVHAPEVAQ